MVWQFYFGFFYTSKFVLPVLFEFFVVVAFRYFLLVILSPIVSLFTLCCYLAGSENANEVRILNVFSRLMNIKFP